MTRLLLYEMEVEVRADALSIVLPDVEPPPLPLSVVYMDGRRASARVHAFIDFAVERLRIDARLQT